MAPTPLLIVCDFNGQGGTQTQVLELLGAMDRQRFSPRLATLTLDRELGRRLEELAVPVINLELSAALRPSTWRALAALADRLARDRVRLVHGFLLQGNAVAAVAARRAGVPYATSVRNLELRKRPHELAVSRWAHRGARVVTFNSTHVRDLVAGREGIPREKTRIILNGLRPEPAGERMEGDPWPAGPGPRLASVASLTWKKGHVFLLDAFARVARERPGARLALVGDGPERGALEARARSLGITAKVGFAGRRADARAIIAASDLLVLSSLEEGMPNVLLEAMAAGVPQVATSVGGTPETLEEGDTGFLVPPGDPVLMAERILKLLGDPRRRAAFGERGRRLFQERFGVESMARRHEELYGEILS